VFRAGGVVDDGDEEAFEIDLDAGEQFGERLSLARASETYQ